MKYVTELPGPPEPPIVVSLVQGETGVSIVLTKGEVSRSIAVLRNNGSLYRLRQTSKDAQELGLKLDDTSRIEV